MIDDHPVMMIMTMCVTAIWVHKIVEGVCDWFGIFMGVVYG